MAETSWDAQAKGDSGFTHSALPAYVTKRLLEPPQYYGDPSPFAVKGEMDANSGETVRWVRYRPLKRNRTQAVSTQLSTPLDLTADKVEATLENWEAFTRFTTRAAFYLGHPIFETALAKHNELFHRTGRLNIFDVLIAGTNTFYGGGKTSIDTLTTSDEDVGTRAKKAITQFRRIGAMPCDGKYYPAFCNPDVIDILLDDTTYTDAESFQGRGLYDSEVTTWRGASWYPTNLLPIRQRLADLATPTEASTGGSLLQSTTYYFVIVGINPLTGQQEYVSQIQSFTTAASGTSTNTVSLVMPSATAIELEPNTDYVYDVYWGTTNAVASLYQSSTDNDAAATVTVTTTPTSGTTAPVAPASGVKVTPIVVLGKEAYGNTYSKLFPYGNFKPSIVSPTPTIGNDLGLLRSVGWSLDQKAVILNQNFMAVIWIGYA